MLSNVLPILFHEVPSGPWRGGQLQVYLKLFLVYLMNGCLSKEQGGSAKRVSGTLMCVFKGAKREVALITSTATVIRKFSLLVLKIEQIYGRHILRILNRTA